MKKIIITSIIILLLMGYTPYYELNDMNVIDVIGITYQKSHYTMYMNVVNENNKVYKITGKSLGELFDKSENINTKKTYYHHLNIIIFDKNTISQQKTIPFLKNKLKKLDYLTFTSNTKLTTLFKKYHKSQDYYNFLKKEKSNLGTITNTTFKKLLSDTLDPIKSSHLPLISSNKIITSDGLYIIDNNLSINKELARTSYILNNQVNSYQDLITYQNKYYQLEIYNLKPTITYHKKHLKITLEGNIDSNDTNNLKPLTKVIKKDLKKNIKDLINLETTKNLSITNINNYIYLKDRHLKNYKTCHKDINIILTVKEKDNYD